MASFSKFFTAIIIDKVSTLRELAEYADAVFLDINKETFLLFHGPQTLKVPDFIRETKWLFLKDQNQGRRNLAKQ